MCGLLVQQAHAQGSAQDQQSKPGLHSPRQFAMSGDRSKSSLPTCQSYMVVIDVVYTQCWVQSVLV